MDYLWEKYSESVQFVAANHIETQQDLVQWATNPAQHISFPLLHDPSWAITSLYWSGDLFWPLLYIIGPDGIVRKIFSEGKLLAESALEGAILDVLNEEPFPKSCHFIVDRSTFSEHEVNAMLHQGSPATIEAAFYVVAVGFSPEELGVTQATLSGVPDITPALIPPPEVTQMSVEAVGLDVEDPLQLELRQRLTWTYKVTFTGIAGFGFAGDVEAVTLSASIETVSSSATLYLIKQPNPYEVDGPVAWLSTDLRVFQLKEGESRFGATLSTGASQFITQVIGNLSSGNTGGQTFDSISTDQETSRLELSEKVGGVRVYDFAVARVRYRALAESAPDVRVFFRLFPASSTSLDYDPGTTYRRGGQGGAVIPLLGLQGGELVTIPCFAAPRIDATSATLDTQTDLANVQPIPPDASGKEVARYFGCWLDINQTQKRFPIHPVPPEGMFQQADLKSIQELIRNQHQCLVAEIAFDPDPIRPGASPSLSDKLAQRNLAIVESANPGVPASRHISQTFEIRPTPRGLGPGEPCDELMLDWGDTPIGSLATLYLPGADTNEVLALAKKMYRSHTLVQGEGPTLQCRTGGITYVPIPPGDGANWPGLLSVDLPDTVRKGQVFTIVVHQVTSAPRELVTGDQMHLAGGSALAVSSVAWGRRIRGTFQITMPVRVKEEMLEPEERLLSNLRWIERTIPGDDRWAPVFGRYVGQVADRVDALGGDARKVVASPSDDWRQRARRCAAFGVLTSALLGALVVVLGTLAGSGLTAAGTAVFVFLLVTGSLWIRNCRPTWCARSRALIAGTGVSALILVLLLLLGRSTPQLATIAAASAAIALVALLAGWWKGCFSR